MMAQGGGDARCKGILYCHLSPWPMAVFPLPLPALVSFPPSATVDKGWLLLPLPTSNEKASEISAHRKISAPT